VYDKICRRPRAGGRRRGAGREYGMPVINQRISVTPVALVAEAADGR
jgi:uncharacterized protein (UPF0210 family)